MCFYVLQAILIYNFVDFTPLAVGNYVLPDWSQTLGWLMAVAPVAMIPIFAVYQFFMLSTRPPYSPLGLWRVNIKEANKMAEPVLKSVGSIPNLMLLNTNEL